MEIDQLYDQALIHMEHTVNLLAENVPPPQKIQYIDSFVFRHTEKTLHQALVQKLARLVSNLNATRLLMEHGFVQEQAALQRILDELNEDITFLAYGVIFDNLTPLHSNYLGEFFKEEFNTDSAIDSEQKRGMIPRKKIRAYIASIIEEFADLDQSNGLEAMRTISKTYSGYIHAASPQIMTMYGGNPPKFYVRGMLGTLRHDEHRADLWNYFYRSIIAFALSAKAFGANDLYTDITAFVDKFANISAKDYQSKEWENI